jgi:hypothetical protein
VHVEITLKWWSNFHFVNPQDIILYRAFTFKCKKCFQGKIAEITDLNNLVKLKVDVGRVFGSDNSESFNDMALTLGSQVCIILKLQALLCFRQGSFRSVATRLV